MTIGEIAPGQSFTLSALGGVRYTVLDSVRGHRVGADLTRCSYWNEWQRRADETTFASHLVAHLCPPVGPAAAATTPAAEA